jgi:hypothetical protein
MQALQKAKPVHAPIKDRIKAMMLMGKEAGFPVDRATAKRIITEELQAEMWVNDTYTVLYRQGKAADQFVMIDEWKGKCGYISIRRNDREPVDSWRDFQEIKNQLCGPNREAVQLYPAEDRLADTANQYHVWVLPEGILFPMGFFEGRVVSSGDTEHKGIKTKQSNR